MVYGSEPLEFELEVLCMEPLEESNFVVMQERLLKNAGDPLMLLCMHQWVIDVAGNDGLNVRQATYVMLSGASAPQVFH